jgi:hypothetical protein
MWSGSVSSSTGKFFIFSDSLNVTFMHRFRLVRDLGLKTTLDQYKVPREDLPTIAERALGGRTEIHGDVVAFLEALYS